MKEFDRVIGYDSIKRELSRIIDVIKNSEKYEALGGLCLRECCFCRMIYIDY